MNGFTNMATWSTGARISESNHLRSSVLLLTAALHLSMSSIGMRIFVFCRAEIVLVNLK